jgi:hypothetical protein
VEDESKRIDKLLAEKKLEEEKKQRMEVEDKDWNKSSGSSSSEEEKTPDHKYKLQEPEK